MKGLHNHKYIEKSEAKFVCEGITKNNYIMKASGVPFLFEEYEKEDELY